MCLIVVACKVHYQYPLIIAANRDELFNRPSRTAHFWPDASSVLAGRDMEQGGSWLGLSKNGRVAAVTNYRNGVREKSKGTSRGLLVSNYLQGCDSPAEYLRQCIAQRDDYNGFNLLLGDLNQLYFLSSRANNFQELRQGMYGISNGELDEHWPKVSWAKGELLKIIESESSDIHDAALSMLANTDMPEDGELPDTGIGIELERILAPVFISTEDYGTRASTVITIDMQGLVHLSERSYGKTGKEEEFSHYEFHLSEGG